MSLTIIKVHYMKDGIITAIPTIMIYEQSVEDKTSDTEIYNVHYEVDFGKTHIVSETQYNLEYSVAVLQRALPSNINLACCSCCEHGSFCPYGDNENEIFCLKGMDYTDRQDVCNIFTNGSVNDGSRTRRLLGFCDDYAPVLGCGHYTYNDWEYKLQL